VWLPYSAAAPESWGPDVFRSEWLTGVIARLRPGVSPAAAAAECTAIYRSRFVQSDDSTATVSLGSVRGAVGPTLGRDEKLSIWLALMCAIVLLIACANVANLLLARAVQRKREIAVRLSLGATRGRLARQLLAESAVLAVLGGCAALLTTTWVGPVLSGLLLPDAALGPVLDTRILLFASLVILATTVFTGLAPAYQASATDLASALKAGERQGTFPRSFSRTAILIGQVALTLILLTGAGLFVGSLRHVQGQHFGFDVDRLLVAAVDLRPLGYKRAEINALYQQMRGRVKALPGITGASLAIGDPFRNVYTVSVAVPGLDSLPRVETGGPYVAAVTPDYFRTMGTSIRRGRGFDGTDVAGAQRVAVVNETMARLFWPGENPLGKCLRIGERATQCTEVVGVAEDTRPGRVTDGVLVQYFIPLAQADSVMHWSVTALLVRTLDQSEGLVAAVRRQVQATSARLPYPDVDPMPGVLGWKLRPWRLGSSLLSVFGALGLLLTAIGLYGVLSYVVSCRTQEMGIRIALGAGRREIVELIMGQALRVMIWGVAIGVAGALAASRAIASLLYGVTPHDPLVLSVVVVVLAAVAAVASYLPARRATRVDPMVALRYE
jgi:predicted permease